MDDNDIKRMDLTEFRDGGFLQEVNRQFFHPLGLALEVVIVAGEAPHSRVLKLNGIWDYRNDPDGLLFDDLTSDEALAKANNVRKIRAFKALSRLNSHGFVIQPVGKEID